MGRLVLLMLASCLTAALAGAASGAEGEIKDDLSLATFAGGCFWCMEPPFDKIEGVVATIAGYTGGHKPNPSYGEISAGNTGHTEALQIFYDPAIVSYEDLLRIFWRNIDPTTANRQFCDIGNQYRPGIFYHDENQRMEAERSVSQAKKELKIDASFVTEITPVGNFFRAEEYHQDYYEKNPLRYRIYRFNCGRDRRLRELWGESEGHGSN